MSSNEGWSEEQNLALSIVSISSSVLSILGSGSIVSVLTFAFYRGFPKFLGAAPPNLTALLHLSAADFIAATLLLVLGIVSLLDVTNSGSNFNVCFALGVPIHIAFQITCWLTFAYAVQTLLTIRGRGMSPVLFQLRLLCWTVPLTATILSLTAFSRTVDGRGPINWCNEITFGPNVVVNGATEFLYIPLLLAFFGIVIIYALLYRDYTRLVNEAGTISDQERVEMRRVLLLLFAYVGVFFVCWVANMIEVVIFWFDPLFPRDKLFPIFVIEALLNPAQGFLNSLVYGWTNRNFLSVARMPQEMLFNIQSN